MCISMDKSLAVLQTASFTPKFLGKKANNRPFLRKNISHDMRFPTMWLLTSVDSDEPEQPPFKLINSKCCSVSSLTILEYSSD